MEYLGALDEAVEELLLKLHKIKQQLEASVVDGTELARLYKATETSNIIVGVKLLSINKDFEEVGTATLIDVISKSISKFADVKRFYNNARHSVAGIRDPSRLNDFQLAIDAAYEMETELKKLDELRKTGKVEIDIGAGYASYVIPASISIFGRSIMAPPPPPVKAI